MDLAAQPVSTQPDSSSLGAIAPLVLPTPTAEIDRLRSMVAGTRSTNFSEEPMPTRSGGYLSVHLGTQALAGAWLDDDRQVHPILWQAPLLPLPGGLSSALMVSPPDATSQSDAMPDLAALLGFLKQALSVGISVNVEQTWHPQVQWADETEAPLKDFLEAMALWLHAPCPVHSSREAAPLESDAQSTVIRSLSGVVVGLPGSDSESYRFNLREAILAAGLVDAPEHIFFLEGAIAALLALLPLPQTGDSPVPTASCLTDTPLMPQGWTLVLNVEAIATELLLVELPATGSCPDYEHFWLRNLAYGSQALDQDLFCQFLYPLAVEQNRLNLNSRELPLPGEPDGTVRRRLQQQLNRSSAGVELLRLATIARTALTEQAAVTFHAGNQPWTLTQSDLHQRILLPYAQRLNRELNTLLNQTGTAAAAIRQVVCVGEAARVATIAHWLKQKLPNSRIIYPLEGTTDRLIAAGLARLPLFPQVLNPIRHQYSDLFLLREMLSTLPPHPLPFGKILQSLENRGIHTAACQRSILNLLEGNLPIGLIPSEEDRELLAAASRDYEGYRAIAAAPVFQKEQNQYCLNPRISNPLSHYFAAILQNSYQQLEEPLPVTLPTMNDGS